MAEYDLIPPTNPSSVQTRDALQKGLGRALLWARNGRWTDKEALLHACLHDLRFDRQCEDPRGPWLWRIMDAVGVVADFREPILQALRSIHDGLAAQQLCQLCVYYARQGDERFRQRLHAIVAQKPDPTCPWLGEENLIDLDGEAGFLFAARLRGESLLQRDWDWDDGALIDMAMEKVGEPVVASLIDREAQSSSAMRRLRDGWRAALETKTAAPSQDHEHRMRQYTVHDIIHEAEVTRNRPGLFRGWGMYAQEEDLRVILDLLLNSQDPVVLVNYLRVFSNRSMPEFDPRLLGLLDHEDENVRMRAYKAIAKNQQPAIRKFAVDHLAERIHQPNFLELFIRNFQQGDEELLLQTLRIPDDADQAHGLLMDVIDILEHNPDARCQQLAVLAYRLTPCGECRYFSASLLSARKAAPAWLIEECGYDAVADTRELVAATHS